MMKKKNFSAFLGFPQKHPSFYVAASAFFLFFIFLLQGALQAQNCTPGTTSLDIDLTHSADASWQTSGPIDPAGQCCGAPVNHNCMEFVVTLHPDANGISVAFTTPTGSLYYSVNCGPPQSVSANVVNICFDQGDSGPHSITFCRSGTPSYEFAIYSMSNDLDVTLQPFTPVCEGSPGFMLQGGSPSGGIYFINGNAMPYFNVAMEGPGDHEIVYQFTDPLTGCTGFDVDTLTVVALPEITWVVEEFCQDQGMIPLNGASPPGGLYTGNFVSGNHFNADAAIPGTYTVAYQYFDTYGCGSSSSGTLVVNDQPVADAGTDQTVVTGNTTTLYAANAGPGSFAYQWSPAAMFVDANVQNPQTLPLVASTVFTLEVTNTLTGCSASDQMLVNIIGGEIHISEIVSLPGAICLGSDADLWVLPGGGSGSFNYYWTADPPDLPGFPSTAANPVISPDTTTTYTVVVSDANYPTVAPATGSVTVVVNPLPVVTLSMQPTVCANTPNFSLSGGSPAGGTYYLLDAGGNVLDLPYIDFSDFLPHDIGAGDFQIMYEYIDPATGCSNAAFQDFTILPYVKAVFYTHKNDICISNEVTLANHSMGATGYSWDFGYGGPNSNDASPTFVHDFPEVPGIVDYTISLTAENTQGCAHTAKRTVKVYPPVVADFSASQTQGCSDLTVDFTTLADGPILYHFWDFGDGTFSVEENPSRTFVNNSDADTTFTVTLSVMSVNYFCSSTYSVDITVYPAIQAGFTTDPAFGCNPLEVEIGNLATGAIDYEWDFGDGNTSTDENPVSHTFHNTTDSIVTYVITQMVHNAHCSDTLTREVKVFPEIKAAIAASDNIGCSPLTVQFSNLSSSTASGFQWTFGDLGSSSEPEPLHVFENTTTSTITYTVWLKATSDELCTDSVSMNITVHPLVKADFTFNPAQACNVHEATIVNQSFGALDYFWDMDDGTTYTYSDSLQFSHTFDHDEVVPKIYNVSLVVSNAQGCTDTLTRPLTIFPKVQSAFTPSVTEGCSPLEVYFNNESTGASQHLWEFGDGGSSPESSLSHVFTNTSFTNDSVFDVWLYSQSPYHCRDSISTQITVYPDVKADFTITSSQGCSPLLLSIDNHSKGAASLNWNFGDGDTDNSMDALLTHVFENTSDSIMVFQIELIATSPRGCTDTLYREITVFPEVDPAFKNVAEGCHPLEVSFENNTLNADYYAWNFADGITSNDLSPEHTFLNFSHTNPVIFPITLYASSIYGCFATTNSQIEVFPKPDASFQVTNSPGCSPHEIIIENNTMGATTYAWDFDDGSGLFNYSGDTITHTYNHEAGTGPAQYNVRLEVQNTYTCADTLLQPLVVYPNIVASAMANQVEGCHPLTVDFTNLSQGATGGSVWDYGNGNFSQNTQQNHSHTFFNYSHTRDTVYTVVLTSFNDNHCSHSDTLEIRVFPKPNALFSVPNNPGCAPHDIIINNNSVGVLYYTWDMGDGDTLTTDNSVFTHPYHQPSDMGPGQFTIHLVVENDFQCTDTHTQQVVIYPEVIAQFQTQNEGCHPHTAVFENASQGGNLYSWDFGNGITSQHANSEQTFVNYSHSDSKTYTVNLSVESTWGCSATQTQVVTVRPVPKALFEISPSTGCSPFVPEISNLSVGATAFQWDFANGTSQESDTTFTHTWRNMHNDPVVYPITLVVENEFGCQDADYQLTSVFPQVTAAFVSEDNIWEGCSPLTIKFANTSLLADSYKWDFADSSSSSSAGPLHVFLNEMQEDRIFPVELISTSVFGCKDTVVQDVKVFPSPEAYFTAQPLKQPYPNTEITLINGSRPGNWDFRWEFGDGNHRETSSFDPQTYSYVWDETDMSTKEYIVALIVQSQHCSDMYTQKVIITSPIPKAEFTSVKSGCEPFSVQFSNKSMYAHSFRWEFGDGSVSTDPAPEHTFLDPGDYDVFMVAIGDGGKDTTFHYVEVIENPTALFELEIAHINIPEEPLRVINHSELADFYFWDFGDGNTSYDFEPEYYYEETGIYDITLIASRNSQPLCHDTLRLKNALRVDETCKIVFPDAFIPSQSGPGSGAFDPNNPSTSVFHPVYEGVEDYVLEIYNRWGELIFRSEDVNIGWDGYHNGKLSQMDVYVWKVTGRCSNGMSIIKAGDVTLYR